MSLIRTKLHIENLIRDTSLFVFKETISEMEFDGGDYILIYKVRIPIHFKRAYRTLEKMNYKYREEYFNVFLENCTQDGEARICYLKIYGKKKFE